MNYKIDQSRNELRRKWLRGEYPVDSAGGLWIPSWKLLVFVSSTFTDTNRERDALQHRIQKTLSKEGSKHGIVISFSDMRWGIPGAASNEHGTWIACNRELDRCYRQSNGIFFLSLQSEKYLYESCSCNGIICTYPDMVTRHYRRVFARIALKLSFSILPFQRV